MTNLSQLTLRCAKTDYFLLQLREDVISVHSLQHSAWLHSEKLQQATRHRQAAQKTGMFTRAAPLSLSTAVSAVQMGINFHQDSGTVPL